MNDDSIFGRDPSGPSTRSANRPTEGMRMITPSQYANWDGPVQYRSQSTLPPPHHGVYVPQNHVQPQSYQNQHGPLPFSHLRRPQMPGVYGGGSSVDKNGPGFDSASNLELGYDEIQREHSGNIQEV
jgi:hypothetical protein